MTARNKDLCYRLDDIWHGHRARPSDPNNALGTRTDNGKARHHDDVSYDVEQRTREVTKGK
jgi:hypothetical protein